MMRFTCCLGASALLALSALTVARAQGVPDHDHSSPIACGSTWMNEVSDAEMMANTARLKPDVYRRIVADNKRDLPSTLSASDDTEWEFKVSNRVTNTYDVITAVLVWEGERALIWVDKADWTNASRKNAISKFLPQIQRALDTASGATSRNPNQGVIKNDEDVFGPPPSRYAEEWFFKTNFLMTDIKDGFSGGTFVAGYFSPTDQFPVTEKPASNQMNLLYIDSKDGITGPTAGYTLANTMAHEYQHLLHHGFNRNSEIVFNEGCSEVASILNGYADRTSGDYLRNTNVDMFRWSYDNGAALLADYARAMTLVHYLTEQYGEGFLGPFVRSQTQGMERVADALDSIGRGRDWQAALKGFAVANYLQTTGPFDPYKYHTSLKGGAAKVTATYTGSDVFSSLPIPVEGYGTAYYLFNNPQGALKFRFSGVKDYAVMAMSYRGSEVTVQELQHDKDQYIGEWGAYDKVVLAVINLSSTSQTIQAQAQHIVLGVDDQAANVAGLKLLGNTPNPVQEATTIAFAVPGSEAVTLRIYNARGEHVATLIDGERMEVGEHRVRFRADDLSNGYYVARLTQGDHTVSTPIVIVK